MLLIIFSVGLAMAFSTLSVPLPFCVDHLKEYFAYLSSYHSSLFTEEGTQTEPHPSAVNGNTEDADPLGNGFTGRKIPSFGNGRLDSSDAESRLWYTTRSSLKNRRRKGRENMSPILPKQAKT